MTDRFAPSPAGTLHSGDALAVANRDDACTVLLRIDDTDTARQVPGGEEAVFAHFGWLGAAWDEGPVGRSDRLRAVRASLTGAGSGPAPWALLAAPPRAETLAGVDAAL